MKTATPVHTVAAATLLLCATASAQNQVVKPAYTQYWMDVATLSMAGMDEMPSMGGGGGLGGLIGGAIGGAMGVPGMGGPEFGATRGMMPGRWLDLAVVTQRKPAGTEATQNIPPGQAMGKSLTLLPVTATPAKSTGPSEREQANPDQPPERPKGRILFYWGCSEKVRPGQPRILDFSTAGMEEYGKFMMGRAVRDRGAKAEPGHAIWPNEKNRQNVPKEASLVGQHEVTGDGLPTNLRFTLGQQQDIMPKLDVASSGGGAAATQLSWGSLPTAQAYFFSAMGGAQDEMVIWSSSDVPEPGWGLMDYASNANVDKWLKEKVLLGKAQTQCAIPEGVFAQSQGGMLRGIAYGQELNLVHPPRPTDKRVPWEQEWVARVRVKSMTMVPLGQEQERSPSRKADTGRKPEAEKSKAPGLEDLGNALKGLFGR